MAKDKKKHTTSLYEQLAATPELVKLFQHEKEAREAREAVNEVWKKVEVSISINRTPVDRTAPKALTNDRSEPLPTAAATDHSTPTKTWMIAKARSLKAAGEITERMSKTELAYLLEEQSKVAAKAGELKRPLTMRYIRNQLQAWGLWPISSIK
jgi:hypothetical protein